MLKKHLIKQKQLYYKILAAVFWILLWQAVSMLVGDKLIVPSPLAVLNELFTLAAHGSFWKSVLQTFYTIVIGFLGGMILGVLFAALSYRFKLFRILFSPLNSLIKTLPVVSFIIILFFIFAQRLFVPMAVSALIVLPSFYSNVLGGLDSTDKKLLEMVAVFKVSPAKRILIYAVECAPFFLTAAKTCLGLCWKAGVAAEAIAGVRNTIGDNMQLTKMYLQMPALLAWTVVVAALSVIFERLAMLGFKLLNRRLCT